jgi:hypothetical protein
LRELPTGWFFGASIVEFFQLYFEALRFEEVVIVALITY